ncbi:MAG: mRNA surveillance protein pelota [Candidatus Woesearchaeota archaeon]
MNIRHRDMKTGLLKIDLTNPEDLWVLSGIIEPGDSVRGRTERKIKIGDQENAKVVRKPVFLELNVEKVEYEPRLESLRVLGTITDGPEDVGRGDHHSFSLQVNDSFELVKKEWPGYMLTKIEEACKPQSRVLVAVFDREQATIGILSSKGLDVIAEFKGNPAKKQYSTNEKDSHFKDLAVAIKTEKARVNAGHVIIASPGFWNEYLLKEMDDETRKNTVIATCSGGDVNSLHEVLRRPEVASVLQKERAAREAAWIDELLAAIAKEKAFYGVDEAEAKINEGNVKKLLVSERYLEKERENKSTRADKLMRAADKIKAEVIILTSDVERLDGLGGIAGILRWQN